MPPERVSIEINKNKSLVKDAPKFIIKGKPRASTKLVRKRKFEAKPQNLVPQHNLVQQLPRCAFCLLTGHDVL